MPTPTEVLPDPALSDSRKMNEQNLRKAWHASVHSTKVLTSQEYHFFLFLLLDFVIAGLFTSVSLLDSSQVALLS